jgi:hypothetical protein
MPVNEHSWLWFYGAVVEVTKDAPLLSTAKVIEEYEPWRCGRALLIRLHKPLRACLVGLWWVGPRRRRQLHKLSPEARSEAWIGPHLLAFTPSQMQDWESLDPSSDDEDDIAVFESPQGLGGASVPGASFLEHLILEVGEDGSPQTQEV